MGGRSNGAIHSKGLCHLKHLMSLPGRWWNWSKLVVHDNSIGISKRTGALRFTFLAWIVNSLSGSSVAWVAVTSPFLFPRCVLQKGWINNSILFLFHGTDATLRSIAMWKWLVSDCLVAVDLYPTNRWIWKRRLGKWLFWVNVMNIIVSLYLFANLRTPLEVSHPIVPIYWQVNANSVGWVSNDICAVDGADVIVFCLCNGLDGVIYLFVYF